MNWTYNNQMWTCDKFTIIRCMGTLNCTMGRHTSILTTHCKWLKTKLKIIRYEMDSLGKIH